MTGPRKGARAKSELAIPRSAPDQMSAMFLQSTSQSSQSDASRKREEKEGRTYPPAVTTDQNVQLSAPEPKPSTRQGQKIRAGLTVGQRRSSKETGKEPGDQNRLDVLCAGASDVEEGEAGVGDEEDGSTAKHFAERGPD